MADTVTTKVLVDNGKQYVVHLTNKSDGTGESKVVKADKSAIAAALSTGAAAAIEAVSLDIDAVRWCVQGFPYVQLEWDHTADETAMLLSGNGYEDFLGAHATRGTDISPALPDGRGAGVTGDILLTAPAGATTGSYDITLYLRKTNV